MTHVLKVTQNCFLKDKNRIKLCSLNNFYQKRKTRTEKG